jgi:hypothetical protein
MVLKDDSCCLGFDVVLIGGRLLRFLGSMKFKEKMEKAISFKMLILPSHDEDTMLFQGLDNYSFLSRHCGTALNTCIIVNTTVRT